MFGVRQGLLKRSDVGLGWFGLVLIRWHPCRWHPRFRIGLLALPLCGAAPTFLCSGKEK